VKQEETKKKLRRIRLKRKNEDGEEDPGYRGVVSPHPPPTPAFLVRREGGATNRRWFQSITEYFPVSAHGKNQRK
jgi:hypothetical protein